MEPETDVITFKKSKLEIINTYLFDKDLCSSFINLTCPIVFDGNPKFK